MARGWPRNWPRPDIGVTPPGGLVYVGVVVGDTLQQIHAAEQQRIVEAARNYFARIGPVTLSPEQYLGIGLSPTDEKALHTLFAIKTRSFRSMASSRWPPIPAPHRSRTRP
ncbi:MAG: hypothetical protein BWX84_02998 [Verrucomicrobia bacterium ADurb.Bin118]|jgi:hypothetical protein|nr:MAG: hypothetical protein BWX84_02998 [Verrucomicrobia bacterium ADurb.Bin118]